MNFCIVYLLFMSFGILHVICIILTLIIVLVFYVTFLLNFFSLVFNMCVAYAFVLVHKRGAEGTQFFPLFSFAPMQLHLGHPFAPVYPYLPSIQIQRARRLHVSCSAHYPNSKVDLLYHFTF